MLTIPVRLHRAGQKGICSKKWISEDLPWSESGLVPDIVFNPHGFPSRMTIAMMVECMAGKSGAINGYVHDATPFRLVTVFLLFFPLVPTKDGTL